MWPEIIQAGVLERNLGTKTRITSLQPYFSISFVSLILNSVQTGSVFYVSRVFSNVRSVLSQCTTRLRLLHLLYDIEVMWRKTLKHAFSMFYTLIIHGFLTNQSARRVLSIL